jgi:hypothetical protein
MMAVSSANLHRLLKLLLPIGRRHPNARGRGSCQVLGRKIEPGDGIWSGSVYNRRTGLRPSCGRWSSEQRPNHVGVERRRHRSNGLDTRPMPRIVHNNVVGLSVFPSIGEVLAYLWNGNQARR